MSPVGRLADLLFWLMVLSGAALLAPCLVLPAWLEYQASLDLKALRKQQVERREAEVVKLRKQREHLETDDAYVLRLAHEFLNIEIPGVVRVPVEPSPQAEQPPAATEPATRDEDLVPELSALVEQAMQHYPIAQLFVRDETRPPIMLAGAGLLVAAIVLLGAPASWRARREVAG